MWGNQKCESYKQPPRSSGMFEARRFRPVFVSSQKLKDVESIIKIVELDGDRLVKEYSDEMERMLGSKMKSVKSYFERSLFMCSQFDYYNSMLINTVDEDGNYVELGGEFPLEENEHFNNLPVNTQQSDIQVPTNVYNKDPYILNAIYNSEALNDIFLSNFQKDPTLTWQYFGSSTGFFRIYPGIRWTPDSNGVAAFDCRNRNWYIQAATSPKDIIIMVDISGSMKGLKMTIARHTINTILDTLGENDFVNIIAYTDYVRYVEPCFRGTLVQADLDNREVRPLCVARLCVCVQARASGQGSMCNQAIMLITDGAMEDFESIFEEFNWPERRILIFVCVFSGYYTHISTLADVQENVMEYLHVLSRPMVINHDHDIIWTEAYMDTVLFNTKAQSLLLMTSVAMPVFSKKKETLSHGILLGVVGSDVPLMEVMKLAPRYTYKDGKKLRPKPNYNSVDLSEVEWEDTDELLRTAMVNGETGSISLSVRALVDKGVIVFVGLGVVLTKGHGKLAFMGNVSVEEGLHDLTSPDLSIASEWTYCETDIDPAHRKYNQLQAAIRYLLGKEPDLECDEVLLQQTLFDAVVTAPLEAYWTALMLDDKVEPGVETAFLGTRAGLMRITRYAGVETRVAKRFLSPSDKDNLFTIDHFPLWYRLAVENTPGTFYYYPVNDKGLSLSVPSSIFFILALFSVITCLPNQQTFRPSCCKFDLNCFLVDNNGFILLSKERSEVRSADCLLGACWCQFVTVGVKSALWFFFPQPNLCFFDKACVSSGPLGLGSHKQKKVEPLLPCDTVYPGFMYDPSVREANSLIKCGRCQKMFVVQQIPDSNLVVVVTQADCDCSRHSEHNASVKCNRMRSQKVRRRPQSCHAYHPKENAKDCGGALALSVSSSLFSASLLISMVLHRWV
uniref:VWFA domain-containing protein n=1 Tax=Monopterus albus TaxID=43700 RepID=A0A3Q3K0I8_MONAL